jgi:hypothetical protein
MMLRNLLCLMLLGWQRICMRMGRLGRLEQPAPVLRYLLRSQRALPSGASTQTRCRKAYLPYITLVSLSLC